MRSSGGLLDSDTHTRKHMLSGFLLAPYDYGFGLGLALRYDLPLVHDGFIGKLNDSFSLEMGGDLYYAWYGYYGGSYGYLNVVVPAVEARWTFHFTPQWEAYGKAGVGFRWRRFSDDYGPRIRAIDWFYWNVAVGGLFNVTERLALRAELGYGGIRLGVGLAF